MTACIPDDPAYCFCPLADDDDEPPQIRILVEGLAFAIPTALVALTGPTALPCATASTGRSVSTETPGPRSPRAACAPAPAA